MFAKETYIRRRQQLKDTLKSGLLLFLGNDECGMNYADNTYHYRQDSTFLYFFGSDYAGLAAIIDIDEDREIIFGDELTIDSMSIDTKGIHGRAVADDALEERSRHIIGGNRHKSVTQFMQGGSDFVLVGITSPVVVEDVGVQNLPFPIWEKPL